MPFEPEEEEDFAVLDDMPPLPAPAARLVGGVQGLLEPIRVAAIPHEEAGQIRRPAPRRAPRSTTNRCAACAPCWPTSRCWPRYLLARSRAGPSLWLPWIFLIVGLAVVLPLWLGRGSLTGDPHLWNGVDAAYRAIERLPAGQTYNSSGPMTRPRPERWTCSARR